MDNALEFEKFLKAYGIAVHEGVEFALNRKDALTAISLAQKINLPIFGGDVYIRGENDRLVPAYINWSTDPEIDESSDEYAKRTWKESESFVRRQFPLLADAELLYVFVT